MIYFQELKGRTFRAYEEELNEGIVRRSELEEKVMMYYRRTTPSLQEYYSRYTPEWEAFYASEHLPEGAFLQYLQQMRSTFRKRYDLTDLNVDYYIGQLTQGCTVKELFLDKWHRLLSRKEYDYQYLHIDRLCEAFTLLTRKRGQQSNNETLGSRMQWLLHNYPDLCRRMTPYEAILKRHPALLQLVRLLGKRQREERKFEALSGVDKRRMFRPAPHSDIVGVTLGNDLNSLLPIEYSYLADDTLRTLFMQRYAEKRLQQFDYRSKDAEPVGEGKQRLSGQGPYIVCVDTSGSMQGDRERLSKSAILAIAQLTEKTHRRCYVINFSDEATALQVEDLSRDLPRLAEFLDQRFDGGTDIAPALREAARIVCGNAYRESDIVLISDFEMPPLSLELHDLVWRMKRQKTTFYALTFGNKPEMEYLNLCDRYWEMG